MDILILFLIFWLFIVLMGLLFGFIWNRLAEINPKLEKILFAEEVDRDGNPIEEDF